ncbi:twin-arginine translocation signal domain-containing protein [Streptomyces olivaceoviridis]|uniref:twin-arginine translocation signal domain-containing protein n=1 Tax=Streptomyces olivaceoviridis TaxID=1921 RepID=UPI0033A72C64
MFRDRFQGRAVNRRTFMASAAATAGAAGALPVMSGQAHTSGDQLSTSCDEGLRAGTEDGDAAAQETPCSHGRAHGYRTGQRRPGDPHVVQHV